MVALLRRVRIVLGDDLDVAKLTIIADMWVSVEKSLKTLQTSYIDLVGSQPAF